MLKRLLIAVLVLSLVTAFTGTAFSDVYHKDDARTPASSFDPSNPKFGSIERGNIAPASRSVDNKLIPLAPGSELEAPAPPLGYYCFDLQYGGINYAWLLEVGATDDFYNVRYTADENFACTLKTFWFNWQGDYVGTCDMMAYLWDDDGFGNPGTALDSIFIPNASLPAAGYGWVAVDFGSSPNAPAGGWVFSDGEEYHYGVSARGTATNQCLIAVDDGSSLTGRTYFWDTSGGPGAWVTMLGAYGTDYYMTQSSEYCAGEIPFTDCSWQGYYVNGAYTWKTPDPTWGNQFYAQKFDVAGPNDTLTNVDFYIFNSSDLSFGRSDVVVNIYDDSAGTPSTLLYTTTLLDGTYTPGWNSIAVNMVMHNDFHVALTSINHGTGIGDTLADGTPDNYEKFYSDDGSNPLGRSHTSYDGVNWVLMSDDWGIDVNFIIEVEMCRDPFDICSLQSYHGDIAAVYAIGNSFRKSAATRMTAEGENCQINEVSVTYYNWFDEDSVYSQPSKVSIYTDAAGYPGVEIASIIINPGDYQFYPAATTVDFHNLDVYITGDYWVVLESQNNYDSLQNFYDGTYLVSDDGLSDNQGRSAGLFVNVDPLGVWELMLDHYGLDRGFFIESNHCCIPPNFIPRTCDPMADAGWSTFQGNQQRTGASDLAVGDAWCNLNLNWNYQGAAGITFTGPTIYGDKAVCAFSTQYTVFDIITGTPLYSVTSTAGDGFLIGNGISVAPTIANIGGTDMMFVGGGSTLGFGAIDFNTGAVIWQNTLMSGAGIFGKTSYTTSTILNDGLIDVLYHTTDNGFVVALEAATGALYSGWATNPVNVANHCFASGATDGANLYYTTQDAGTQGDMYSIDAATGAINWTLSGAGGLVASGEAGYNGYPEGFRGGVAYDNGVLYAVSWANDGGVNDHPVDGFFYAVNAANGNHYLPPTATNRADYSTPLVDNNNVYITTLSQWVQPTAGGNILAYRRATGSLVWSATTQDNAKYYTSGLLTCEPGDAADLIFTFNDAGFFECYSALDGNQIFSRRVEHDGSSAEIGMAGALAMTATDGLHLLASDFGGGLYDLTLGADRPRLEMQSFSKTAAVEFGVNPALPVDLGPIIVNTGCVDLNITSTAIDEASITVTNYPAFVHAGYVANDVMQRAASIADAMKRDAFLSKFTRVDNDIMSSPDASFDVTSNNIEKSSTRYSAGIPAWFVSLDQPVAGDIIAPGDTSNLLITVNQPLISRGPQSVYIAFGSDDPDYFLNNDATLAGKLPEFQLIIVGGCLIDTTTLTFGMGSANTQLVTNTSRLGEGDWTPHGFEIDGDGDSYYQGGLIMGVSTYAIAWNNSDWVSGHTEVDSWNSLQPDPNWCDNQCKAALTASVAVGSFSTDGVTYTPINADMVCKTYVDSVENFDTDPDPLVTNWDWSAYPATSFDDTLSMGLMVHARVIGVSDLPELANLTLEILDINERNGVDSVTGWYMGQMTDYDVGGDDAVLDRSISTAWSHNPGGDAAWGSIKIPFGCGTVLSGQDFDYEPLINAKQLDGDMAFFNINAYFDSAYIYLSNGPGLMPAQPQAADGEMHTTYVGHDFEPAGTYSYGIANFGVTGLADNSSGAELADMANMVNKWAGFGRGDVNNDGGINLADIIYLAANVNNGGPGAIPFAHLGDVNADNAIDAGDINYLIDYYFNCGPCPAGDWMF